MTQTIPLPAAADLPEPPQQRADGRRGREPVTGSMVNLLSPWVMEENRVHQLRRRFIGAAIGLVVIMPLVWVGLHLEIIRNQEDLRGEQAVASGLQQQIAELGPTRAYSASVTVRRQLIGETMLSQVVFSRALESLQALLPPELVFESITATSVPLDQEETADVAAPCPGPDPFGARTIVGCMTLSGTAPTRGAVSDLVLALSQSDLFVEPFVETTTTDDEKQVTFSGTVGLDPRLLSSRYANLQSEAAPAAAAETDETAAEGTS